MKQIELNEQETKFLIEHLNFHLHENEWIGNTTRVVIKQILEKLIKE